MRRTRLKGGGTRKRTISRKIVDINKVREFTMHPSQDGRVGSRTLRCVCNSCMEREWAKCVAKEWTGGEPKWERS
eukprot:SAG31_NODE_7943_length_1557_cov_22.395062_1_plen_75_part_00